MPAEPGFLGSPWVRLGLIEAEITLSLVLLSAYRPHLSRLLAMLLFSAFFGVALSKAGASSCACFGFETHPLATAILDMCILLLLRSWRPADQGVVSLGVFSGRALIPALITLAALFPLSVASSRAFFSSSSLLVANSVDLGTVSQGERVEFLLQVENPHSQDVLVTEVQSSCPCLEAVGLAWRFPVRAKASVSLVLDLANEPRFVGPLLIQFRAKTSDLREAIRGEVQVRVVSRS